MVGVPTPSPRTLTGLGAAGAVVLTVSSYWVAATPLVFRQHPPAVVDVLPQGAPVLVVAWNLGLTAVVLAWLGFGRRLWRGEDVGWRTLRTAGLVTAAPLLLANPLMSRDLWAYAAQARIAAAGLDPYRVSPLRFGDVTMRNVSARWVDTTSPYGPLWTFVGRWLEPLFGTHQVLGVLLLRLPAALGFVLLAFAVPALARRVGASPTTATWLAVANPLVVLHGVGGGHNDTLMVGLLAVGLLVAVSAGPRWRALLLAGLLVGAAAAVKLPALVAAPFLPLLWARYRPGAPAWETVPWREAVRRRGPEVVTGLALTAVGVVVAVALATVAAGHGFEWVAAANTTDHGAGPAGTVLLAVVLVGVWALALRGAQLPLLTAALLAPAMVSVLSLAWYWFWPMVPAAMVLRGRVAMTLVAVESVSDLYLVRPNGVAFALRPEFVVVAVAVVVWLVLDRHWRPFTSDAPVDAAAGTARRSSGT